MIRVEKWNGAGNDFVIADADELDDPSALARVICDRETGIGADRETGIGADEPAVRTGADGLLALSIEDGSDGDDGSALPRVRMRLYQPDGGTAEMCGNAARCVAAWGAKRTGSRELLIDPPAGERRAVVEPDAVDGDGEVEVEMGRPSFDPADVPLATDDPLTREPVSSVTDDPAIEGMDLMVTAVDTGVPHAVVIVGDVDEVDLDRVAPPIRHAAVFPEGTNVTIAAARGDGFDQRTYERGVEGETQACGTGAVAVGAVAAHIGPVEWPVEVRPPGGTLGVSVPVDGPATLRGPVEQEYVAELDPDVAHR